MFNLQTEYTPAAGMHNIQCWDQCPGHIVKIKFYNGITVLICNVALSIVSKTEEPWSFSQAWVKSYVSHITGQRVDTVDCNTVCITVGYKNKFA